jgi:hypothetical protein
MSTENIYDENSSASEPDRNTLPPNQHVSKKSRLRVVVLFIVLAVLLGALWYDRMVARAAVVDAYAAVSELNSEMLSSSGHQFTTNLDVQKRLGKAPSSTYTDGGYLVEVYQWQAGVPFKTHKYFAVYTEEPPHVFLKHYAHSFDPQELKGIPLVKSPTSQSADR